jgi:hypothetical protein
MAEMIERKLNCWLLLRPLLLRVVQECNQRSSHIVDVECEQFEFAQLVVVELAAVVVVVVASRLELFEEAVGVVAADYSTDDWDLADKFVAAVLFVEPFDSVVPELVVAAFFLKFDIVVVAEHTIVVVECRFAVVVGMLDFPRLSAGGEQLM